jgi:CRP/FNR family transcriptional regulator, cyclic AMP receptor protein
MTPAEREALCKGAWFGGLPPVLRHDVLRAIEVRHHADGDPIARRGQTICALLACVAGSVRVSHQPTAGRRSTISLAGPGRWFGDVPSAHPQRHLFDAHAHGPCTVAAVSVEAVRALVAQHPAFYDALLQLQNLHMQHVCSALDRSGLDMRARTMENLAMLFRQHGIEGESPNELRLAIRLRQDQLAELVGCSRQRMNEQLRSMETENVLRRERGFLITDRRRLLREAPSA